MSNTFVTVLVNLY